MNLVEKVRGSIEKYAMLSRGDGVLVAVSGGPDSVALLHVLWKLRSEFDLRLEVAHLEHGIRGEEAREDARFVAEMADQLALRFHLKEVELPRIKAERGKGNLEALSREERYRFFAQVASERAIQRIATAHTRDDQVETALMWLLRGSGRKGLGGMAPVSTLAATKKGVVLIRPLIESSREEIEDYLATEKLQYRVDRTNRDPALLRNWIRLYLLPQLRERIDHRLDERLVRLARLLREEESFLEELSRSLFPQVAPQGELLRGPLLEQPKAMQRRLVRLWLEQTLGSLRGLEFDHVEAILGLISGGPPQGRVAVPRGREVVRQYETLRLQKKSRKSRTACYSYTFPLEGELAIPEAGVKIESARCAIPVSFPPCGSMEALLDLASLPATLTVRNFRSGDRFQPLGMQGHKKVKDLFIEKKVPLEVRSTLPLLLAGDEILWVPGYGRSEIAKVGSATREVVRVKVSAISHQQSAGEFS